MPPTTRSQSKKILERGISGVKKRDSERECSSRYASSYAVILTRKMKVILFTLKEGKVVNLKTVNLGDVKFDSVRWPSLIVSTSLTSSTSLCEYLQRYFFDERTICVGYRNLWHRVLWPKEDVSVQDILEEAGRSNTVFAR